jgi:argininosuccinate lyase
MPQKKNPDSLELVRAVAGDAVGDLTGLLTTLKGLPRAYNRDLQRATPHAWDAVDIVTEATEVTAGAVATAEWDAQACAADAGKGFSTATGVADALASAGIPFRTAHELVADAAAGIDDESSVDEQIDALAAAAEDVLDDSLSAYVDEATLADVLSPAGSVTARSSRGGPAAPAVTESLTRLRDTHEEHAAAVDAHREALAAADSRLTAAVTEYV